MASAAVALTVGTQVVVAVGRLPPEKKKKKKLFLRHQSLLQSRCGDLDGYLPFTKVQAFCSASGSLAGTAFS